MTLPATVCLCIMAREREKNDMIYKFAEQTGYNQKNTENNYSQSGTKKICNFIIERTLAKDYYIRWTAL